MAETQKVLPYLRGAEAKLRALVQRYISTYESNPEYTALIMLHLKTSRNFLQTEAYRTVTTAARQLLSCIQEELRKACSGKTPTPSWCAP